jgi:excisionase family DNA binding protein
VANAGVVYTPTNGPTYGPIITAVSSGSTKRHGSRHSTTTHAPMAFSILAACKVAGVGRSKIYEAIRSGALPVRKNGAKNLVLREDLQRWLQNLPTETVSAPSPGVGPRHRPGLFYAARRNDVKPLMLPWERA